MIPNKWQGRARVWILEFKKEVGINGENQGFTKTVFICRREYR